MHAGTTKVGLCRYTQVPEAGPAGNTGRVTKSRVGEHRTIICNGQAQVRDDNLRRVDTSGCGRQWGLQRTVRGVERGSSALGVGHSPRVKLTREAGENLQYSYSVQIVTMFASRRRHHTKSTGRRGKSHLPTARPAPAEALLDCLGEFVI